MTVSRVHDIYGIRLAVRCCCGVFMIPNAQQAVLQALQPQHCVAFCQLLTHA